MDVQATEICCAPVTAEVLSEDQAVELAALLKVLADPARLRLLSLVAAAEGGLPVLGICNGWRTWGTTGGPELRRFVPGPRPTAFWRT